MHHVITYNQQLLIKKIFKKIKYIKSGKFCIQYSLHVCRYQGCGLGLEASRWIVSVSPQPKLATPWSRMPAPGSWTPCAHPLVCWLLLPAMRWLWQIPDVQAVGGVKMIPSIGLSPEGIVSNAHCTLNLSHCDFYSLLFKCTHGEQVFNVYIYVNHGFT